MLRMRFGLDGEEPKTLQEIGEALGPQPRAHPPDREQGQGEAAPQPARAGAAGRAELSAARCGAACGRRCDRGACRPGRGRLRPRTPSRRRRIGAATSTAAPPRFRWSDVSAAASEDLEQLACSGQSYRGGTSVTGHPRAPRAWPVPLAPQGASPGHGHPDGRPATITTSGRCMGIDVDAHGSRARAPEPSRARSLPRWVALWRASARTGRPPRASERADDWPPVSITVSSISDRGTGLAAPARTADDGRDRAGAAAADGKPVRALGQFRGANLCSDLPRGFAREPADWVC